MVVTVDELDGKRPYIVFQSPFHRVNGCNFYQCSLLGLDNRDFQSPFHRVNGCNRLRAAPMDHSRTHEISVFVKYILYHHMKRLHIQVKSVYLQRGLCSSPSVGVCLSLSQIPFLWFCPSIRSWRSGGVGRKSVSLLIVAMVEIRASTRLAPTEDINPFCVGWRLERFTGRFDTKSGTRIYVLYFFSQIALSFPQKLNLRFLHNTSAQNRRNSHSTHFPRCGVGGGIRSSESILLICWMA